LPAELTYANNAREFTMETVREKLRVLYICGQPGPEYSFLRHMLKSDPSIELVSFVILRNPESIALVPENDLSLIPFPVNTIFTRDLYSFDALILENFTYRRFGFLPEYLANIRSWIIDKGGGLVMIAGANSFGQGGWGGTPVEEVLPVSLEQPQDRYEEGLFRPVVENYDNLLMALSDEKEKNEQLWHSIPELDGCQALRPKPGAQVLARHPWKNWTVIAAWDKGKGRSVAVGSNTTWRWALGADTPERYTRFWKNVVRYVTRSGETGKIHAAFDRPSYCSGQDFTLSVPESDMIEGCLLEAECIKPSGEKTVLPAVKQGRKGWKVSGAFDVPGKYIVDLRFKRKESTVFKIRRSQTVALPSADEETVLNVNEPLLQQMADESGGAYFTEESFSVQDMSGRVKRTERKIVRDKIPLWTSPWLLAALILSLFGEWYTRRKLGYW
jgi:uncharacterized membrane protein